MCQCAAQEAPLSFLKWGDRKRDTGFVREGSRALSRGKWIFFPRGLGIVVGHIGLFRKRFMALCRKYRALSREI